VLLFIGVAMLSLAEIIASVDFSIDCEISEAKLESFCNNYNYVSN
jgi:hypothetical protein